MLSERMAARLSTLQYRADAECLICIEPLQGIYWNDEMPMDDLFWLEPWDWEEMRMVFQMFEIRRQLWDGTILKAWDRQLWDAVLRQVPDWPLFKRLSLTDEQRAERQKGEWELQQEFEYYRRRNETQK